MKNAPSAIDYDSLDRIIIGCCGGDGIGPIIMAEAKRLLEKLLADESFSLKQISEIMNFNNAYYFNAFFKKHSGMPPGEYRKMNGK